MYRKNKHLPLNTPSSILHFREFDAFYKTLGFGRKAFSPDFDMLDFTNSANVRVAFMPPFRKEWYQVVFKLNPTKPVWLNDRNITPRHTLLLCNSPNHVYSWQLDTALRGFILFFKPDFVSGIPGFEAEFPFFQLAEPNLIDVSSDDVPALEAHLRQLLLVAQSTDAYRRQTLQALLMAFLYRCKSAYQAQQQATNAQPRQRTIVGRFQQLVNTFYLEKKTVAAYADVLNLTPNYLNELIKSATGKNARHFIVERILTEARNLLRHTDLDISRIAHTLQFDEPTNFVKFFKKYTGVTPGQFRQQRPSG